MTTAAELATPALLSPLESLCCPDGVSDNICVAIIMAMGIEHIVSQKSLQVGPITVNSSPCCLIKE